MNLVLAKLLTTLSVNMSRHKFPSPPLAGKKDANGTNTPSANSNISVISSNSTVMLDTNPDSIVSWIDSLKLRVNDTLSQQNTELKRLRESVKEEELRLKYRSHIFEEPFNKLGEYLKEQHAGEADIDPELPFIEEEEQALVYENSDASYPEEEQELAYLQFGKKEPSEAEDSDVIEIISSEDENDAECPEGYNRLESGEEDIGEDALEEEAEEDLDDNDLDGDAEEELFGEDEQNSGISGSDQDSSLLFSEQEEDDSDEEQMLLENFQDKYGRAASRVKSYKPSFQLHDGRPRLCDVTSYNYFQQSGIAEEQQSFEDDDDLDKVEIEYVVEEEPEHGADDIYEEDQGEIKQHEEDEDDQKREDEYDLEYGYDNEDEDQEDQEQEDHLGDSNAGRAPLPYSNVIESSKYQDDKEDDSIIVLSSEEEREIEPLGQHDEEAELDESESDRESELSESLEGGQPVRDESDEEVELNDEAARDDVDDGDDDDKFFTAIHNVADENNIFANIAQEALIDDHLSLVQEIPSDYPADIECDELIPPQVRFVLHEMMPILQNQADQQTPFDSGNQSSQFDLGTLSGPKCSKEDASEGSLADADTDYKRVEDLPEENIPQPSLKFPIFKTIKEESLEEVYKKLRETERKFHIKLQAVEELKSKLGISEEPEEVSLEAESDGVNRSQDKLNVLTTLHDALLFDSLVMEDLQHDSNKMHHSGSFLADLESSRPTFDSIVDEMLQRKFPGGESNESNDQESIDAILAVATTILDSHDTAGANDKEKELEKTLLSSGTDELPLSDNDVGENNLSAEISINEVEDSDSARDDVSLENAPSDYSDDESTSLDIEENISIQMKEETEKVHQVEDVNKDLMNFEQDELVSEQGEFLKVSEICLDSVSPAPSGKEAPGPETPLKMKSESTEPTLFLRNLGISDSNDALVSKLEEVGAAKYHPEVPKLKAVEDESILMLEEDDSSSGHSLESDMIDQTSDEQNLADQEESKLDDNEGNDLKREDIELIDNTIAQDVEVPTKEGASTVNQNLSEDITKIGEVASFSESKVGEMNSSHSGDYGNILENEDLKGTEANGPVDEEVSDSEANDADEKEVFDSESLENFERGEVGKFSYASYVKPDYPILKAVEDDRTEWDDEGTELDDEAAVIEPYSQEEVLITFDENTIVEAAAMTPTSVEEPEGTYVQEDERVYALDVLTEVLADMADDVEIPTEVVEPTDVEEVMIVEVFEESTEVITPSGIIELESMRNTPVNFSRTLFAEEVLESGTMKRKSDEEGPSPTSLKRFKRALSQFNPFQWRKRDDSEALRVDEAADYEVEYQEYKSTEISQKELTEDTNRADSGSTNEGESERELKDDQDIKLREHKSLEGEDNIGAGAVDEIIESALVDVKADAESEIPEAGISLPQSCMWSTNKEGVEVQSEDVADNTLHNLKEATQEVVQAISDEISEAIADVIEQPNKLAADSYDSDSSSLGDLDVKSTPLEETINSDGTLHKIKLAAKRVVEAISDDISEVIAAEPSESSGKDEAELEEATGFEETIQRIKEAANEVVDAISDDILTPIADNDKQAEELTPEHAEKTGCDELTLEESAPHKESRGSQDTLHRINIDAQEAVEVISDDTSKIVAAKPEATGKGEGEAELAESRKFDETFRRMTDAATEVVKTISDDISQPFADDDEQPKGSTGLIESDLKESGCVKDTIHRMKDAAKEVVEAISHDISQPVADDDKQMKNLSAGLADCTGLDDRELQKSTDTKDTLHRVKGDDEEVVEALADENEHSNEAAAEIDTVQPLDTEISDLDNEFKIPATLDEFQSISQSNKPQVPSFNLIAPLTDNLVDTTEEILKINDSNLTQEIIGQSRDVVTEIVSEHDNSHRGIEQNKLDSSDSSQVQLLMKIMKEKAEAVLEHRKEQHDKHAAEISLEQGLFPEIGIKVEQTKLDFESQDTRESMNDNSIGAGPGDSFDDENKNFQEPSNSTNSDKLQKGVRKRPQRKRMAMGIEMEPQADLETTSTRRSLRSRVNHEDEKYAEVDADQSHKENAFIKEEKPTREVKPAGTKRKPRAKSEPKTETKSKLKVETKIEPKTERAANTDHTSKRGSPRKAKTVQSQPLPLRKTRGRKVTAEVDMVSPKLEVPQDKEVRTASGKWQLDPQDHPALRTRSKSPIKRTIQELSQEMDEEPSKKRNRITRSAVQKRLEQVQRQEHQNEHEQEQERRGRTRDRR